MPPRLSFSRNRGPSLSRVPSKDTDDDEDSAPVPLILPSVVTEDTDSDSARTDPVPQVPPLLTSDSSFGSVTESPRIKASLSPRLKEALDKGDRNSLADRVQLLETLKNKVSSKKLARKESQKSAIIMPEKTSGSMGTANTIKSKQTDSLIEITSKIQDAFSTMGTQSTIDLPQIAVVGSQSAGKSSVLENIVGNSFLPRGSGLCTRRPCVIQLHNTPPGTQEYGEFLHDSTGKKYPMDQIAAEIDADTARVCGANKGLDPNPISLRIYSPNCINLTIIDLPGATRVAVGDQDENIGDQIKDMIMSYIEKPNCIILAVSAANTDLANSDAILLSRIVDPKGERTLGVLTKLDLMDKGTDAREIFMQKSSDMPHLKLGYVGVVNRSQADINEGKSLAYSRQQEMKFFESHPGYRSLKEKLGTEHLVNICSDLLLQSIAKSIPQIGRELTEVIQEKKAALKAMPDTNPKRLRMTLIEMLVEFSEAFKHLIDAKNVSSLEVGNVEMAASTGALIGGSRIEGIFRLIFEQEVKKINPKEEVDASEVQAMLINSKGLGGGMFVPDEAIDTLIRDEVKKLEEPCLKACTLVHNELLGIVQLAIGRTSRLGAFPDCKNQIQKIVGDIMQEQLKLTEGHVKYFIEAELCRVNKSHPDFNQKGVSDLYNDEKQRIINAQRAMEGIDGQEFTTEPPTEENARRALELMQKKHDEGLTPEEKVELDELRVNRISIGGTATPIRGTDDNRPIIGLTHGMSLNSLQPPAPYGAPPPGPPPPGPPPPGVNSRASGVIAADGTWGDGGEWINEASQEADFNAKINENIGNFSMEELIEINIVLELTKQYFDIVKKTACDMFPKAISLFLISDSSEKMTTGLIGKMTNQSKDEIEQMLSFSEATHAEREELTTAVKLLEEANHVLMTDVVKAASFGLKGDNITA